MPTPVDEQTQRMYEALCEPFPPEVLEWRALAVGNKTSKPEVKNGLLFTFITARAVMDRLDQVCGWDGWRDEYLPSPNGTGVLCRLYVRLPDGEWIVKEDSSGQTEVEPEKGSVSGALKRAAVKYGIGRYLYGLGDTWAKCLINGKSAKPIVRPALPKWALPKDHPGEKGMIVIDSYLHERYMGSSGGNGGQASTAQHTPASAPKPAVAQEPKQTPVANTNASTATERARAYVIPEGHGIPFEGRTLGNVLDEKPVLGRKVLSILAGHENGASFKPVTDEDNKLVLAAEHLLSTLSKSE